MLKGPSASRLFVSSLFHATCPRNVFVQIPRKFMYFYFFANRGFQTLWGRLIPPNPERSQIKTMWPSGGSTRRLNVRFLKRWGRGPIPRPVAPEEGGTALRVNTMKVENKF